MYWYKPFYKSAKRDFSVIGFSLLGMLIIPSIVIILYSVFLYDKFDEIVYELISMGSVYFIGLPVCLLILRLIKKDSCVYDTEAVNFSSFLKYLCVSILFLNIGSYFGSFLDSIFEMITGISQTNVVDLVSDEMNFWVDFPVSIIISQVHICV